MNSDVEIFDDLEPMDDFEGSCSSDEACSAEKPTKNSNEDGYLLDLDWKFIILKTIPVIHIYWYFRN